MTFYFGFIFFFSRVQFFHPPDLKHDFSRQIVTTNLQTKIKWAKYNKVSYSYGDIIFKEGGRNQRGPFLVKKTFLEIHECDYWKAFDYYCKMYRSFQRWHNPSLFSGLSCWPGQLNLASIMPQPHKHTKIIDMWHFWDPFWKPK